MVWMRGKEVLRQIKQPHRTDLGPLENPSTLRRQADGMLQATKEADKTVPATRLIPHAQSDLVVAGRLILGGWRHRGTRKPDNKAAAACVCLKHRVPHMLLLPKGDGG